MLRNIGTFIFLLAALLYGCGVQYNSSNKSGINNNRLSKNKFSKRKRFKSRSSLASVGRVHKDDEPIKDVEVSNVDLKDMTRKMAIAIIELEILTKYDGPVVIAFLTISNRTLTVDFDSNNLQSMIRKQVTENSKKIQFIDNELANLIYAERDAKRSGQRTSSKRSDLPGVDYFLKGEAYSNRKTSIDGEMSAYHRYSFRLTDAETGIVAWEKDYEFKKVGQRGMAYR